VTTGALTEARLAAGRDQSMSSHYLLVEEVAERLRCSRRTVHELTRTSAIPHRRLPGCRRCLFRSDELEAWENGSPLEAVDLPSGGRLVVPRAIA
jgi:excisionase family DNA binding protein